MASKFDGDVRPLSNDPLYMGVVFSGSMKNALKQAQAAPEYGMPAQIGRPGHISRERWNLLEHLNLSLHFAQRMPPKRAGSPYSLEYAISRGWVDRVQS